jgi:hypothetical protein
MMDEYKKLHQDFLDLLLKYHNASMLFFESPSAWRGALVFRTLYRLGPLFKQLRKANLKLRKELINEKRKKVQESKILKEQKKEKKKNGNNKTTSDQV